MTANRNGDEFIAAKLREALSGYVGQRLDLTTLESVRDRVIENLPGRFAGTTVDVKQDAADPTKVNVKITVPVTLSPYDPVKGRVLCGGTWGLWQSHYFWASYRFVRTPVMMPHNVGIGFRVHLPGRSPRFEA